MKKYIILVIVAMFLVACNDKVSTLEKENPAVEQVDLAGEETPEEVAEETEGEIEREPLPFDKDEFIERYFEIAEGFEGLEGSMKLSVKDDFISLTFGNMIEAQILLNVLSELTEDEVIDKLTEELLSGLIEDGFYINELNTSDLSININAIEVDSVMVVVTSDKSEANSDYEYVALNLKEFVHEYNTLVNRLNKENNEYPHLELINIDEVNSTYEANEHWHNVLSDSDDKSNYGIELMYGDEMNILEYHVGMSSEDGYSHFYSAGLASAATIAEILQLDLNLYLDNVKKSLEMDDISHKYEDAGYEILFMDFGFGESGTLTFNFSVLE